MDIAEFTEIRAKISKRIGIVREYLGHSDFCVIGLMTLGLNKKVSTYYFDLLEELEADLETKIYMTDGDCGESDLQEFRHRKFFDDQAQKRAGILYLNMGLGPIAGARVIRAGEDTSARYFGLEEKELFYKTTSAYVQAARLAPEINIMLDILLERLDELSKRKGKVFTSWKKSINAAKTFARLEVLPQDLDYLKREIFQYSLPETLFPWFEPFQVEREKHNLSCIEDTFIKKLRERINYSIDFYTLTVKRSDAIAKNIVGFLEKMDFKIVFVTVTGFIWYLLFNKLKNLGCSYFVLETPSLHSLNVEKENPNLDPSLYDMASGKKFGIDLVSILDKKIFESENNKEVRNLNKEDLWNLDEDGSDNENIKTFCLLEKRMQEQSLDTKNPESVKKFDAENKSLVEAHIILYNKIEKALKENKIDDFEKYLTICIGLLEKTGDKMCLALGLHYLHLIHLVKGNKTDAVSCLKQAGELFKNVGNLNAEAKTLYELSAIESQMKNYNNAKSNIERAIKLFYVTENPKDLAKSYWRAGMIEQSENIYSDAKEHFLKAKKIFHELDDKNSLISVTNQLIIICNELKQEFEAMRYSMEIILNYPKIKESVINKWKEENEDLDLYIAEKMLESWARYVHGRADWAEPWENLEKYED